MMRGLVPFAAGVVLCGAIVTAAGQAPTQPPAATPADDAAPEWLPKELKNLKVLPKDIEPKQLLVVMRGFTQALLVHPEGPADESGAPCHRDGTSST